MKPLIFDTDLGRQKPENIRNTKGICPFCNRKELINILDTDGDIIWLMNKYPVLDKSWPTVIIETTDCHAEFSKLPLEEATHILDFSLSKWRETIASKRFASVLYLKNFGPMSGGSLKHPHSQIIGLYEKDYKETIHKLHFEGRPIYESEHLKMTLSTHPLIGFYEFNIITTKDVSFPLLTKQLQGTLRYLLESFSANTSSYNYFFYDLEDGLTYTKIVPRYMTSPIFVGYGLPQISNERRSLEVISQLQTYLLSPGESI